MDKLTDIVSVLALIASGVTAVIAVWNKSKHHDEAPTSQATAVGKQMPIWKNYNPTPKTVGQEEEIMVN